VRRATSQGGFTVVELLVAMAVLGVVAIGAMTLIEVVMRQGRGVLDRTESAQRGRLTLDAMTRQIRSQVCLDEKTKGLVAATPTSLTFYADLSDGSSPPTKRMLEYQPSADRIVERVYVPASAANPTTETVLLQDVAEAEDESKPKLPSGQHPPLHFFSYFAYPDPLPPSPVANEALPGTLNDAAVARIARIEINFAVRPTGARNDDFATPLSDGVVLRNADPNATNPDPTCA
jgi:prepilin-type N-terminal cleavage/methylation domain-containing protein